jgi:UDP-N-acetylglucosamine:LPS N-acetylglucosamine transferase
MITMGGIPWHYHFLEQLAHTNGVYFLVPGADEQIRAGHQASPGPSGLVLLPHHSNYFHPDLVNASDAVIGKAGYSTLAEVYHAGVPFGYVARPRFRESQVLASYIEQHMHGLPVAEKDFQDGNWLASVDELLAMPRLSRDDAQGADQAARFIGELLDGKR